MSARGAQSQVVQIVKFDEAAVKAYLDFEAFKKVIESRPEVKELPITIVSIGGVARSGKSFLLNLFVSYLTYLEQKGTDESWEKSNDAIAGINWAQSKDSVTNGTWMWGRPFIVSKTGNASSTTSKVAVLLVDTQGTGDNKRTESLNTLIKYLSLQISSVQLLNVWRYLTADDISTLQLVSEMSETDTSNQPLDAGEDCLFNTLIFILRDYQASSDIGEDTKFFSNIEKESKDAPFKKTVAGIQKSYRSISTFNMPSPGDRITTASVHSKDWKLDDVSSPFIAISKKLIQRILELSRLDEEQPLWSTGSELLVHFKKLKAHVENDDFMDFPTPADALRDVIMYKAYSAATKDIQKKLDQFQKQDVLVLKTYPTEESLQADFEKQKSATVEKFRKDGLADKYAGTLQWRKYNTMLESTFNSTYQVMSSKYCMIKRAEEERLAREKIQKELEETRRKQKEETDKLNAKLDEQKKIQAATANAAAASQAQLQNQVADLQHKVKKLKDKKFLGLFK